ncbi:MAG: sulfite exporter TauE/SafE family protein [Deltaproteobacteria bacterium]|nr:sulfite exporter TauE/SafE family protein [Deltaproteobacteria bacterium]
MNYPIMLVAFFLIAVVMTMAGRGGGNFYVLAQVVAGISMHSAASTGQMIMCCTSVAAMFVFQKNKTVAWPMAVFIALTTSIMAFFGGFVAHFFTGMTLKLVFATMLVLAGFLMLFSVTERKHVCHEGIGYWRFNSGGETVVVNLWLAVPLCLGTGFIAGMVGVSGGSFLIPLMVLACGMPMKTAVGTASVMVAATAGMGFLGHLSRGGFDLLWALPLAGVAVVGGLIGGKLVIKIRPKALKHIFALTTLAAAVFMYIKAFYD